MAKASEKRTTTYALEILDQMFFTGRPEMYEGLEKARLHLDIVMKLNEMREQAGLTQQQLADRAGTSRSVIARLESPGYDKHTLTTLDKVAGAMGYAVRVDFIPKADEAGGATMRRRSRTSSSKKNKGTKRPRQRA